MFTLKIVARPDPRMVEVPLEFECELPHEFDGQAVLASSGVPRKVKLKAAKDAVKISTAYRADMLVADIVRDSLKASPADTKRAQDAAQKFVRQARERRQDGATLTISSNGRGKIEIAESAGAPPARPPPLAPANVPLPAPTKASLTPPRIPLAPQPTTAAAVLIERIASLDRRVSQLEKNVAAVHSKLHATETESVTRVGLLQQRLDDLTGQVGRASVHSELRAPLMPGEGPRTRRSTAVDAFAEGLRAELRDRAKAALDDGKPVLERIDKAAALAVEAALSLSAPRESSSRLHDLSAKAASRQQGLQRIADESDFYLPADLPVAALLVERLEKQQLGQPAEPLRAAIAAARGDDLQLADWLTRAALVSGDTTFDATSGETFDAALHDPSAISEPRGTVIRTVAPGVKRGDGHVVRRPRVDTTERKPESEAEPKIDATALLLSPAEDPLASPAPAPVEPRPDRAAPALPAAPPLEPPAAADAVEEAPAAVPAAAPAPAPAGAVGELRGPDDPWPAPGGGPVPEAAKS